MATFTHVLKNANGKVNTSDLEQGANGVLVKDANNKVPFSDLPTTQAANNVVAYNANGKIPIAAIEDGLDELAHYNDLASFPATGVADIIYIARDTGLEYLWSSGTSAYVPRLNGSATNPATNITMPNASTGIVLISPNSTAYLLLVDDDGALTTTTPVP